MSWLKIKNKDSQCIIDLHAVMLSQYRDGILSLFCGPGLGVSSRTAPEKAREILDIVMGTKEDLMEIEEIPDNNKAQGYEAQSLNQLGRGLIRVPAGDFNKWMREQGQAPEDGRIVDRNLHLRPKHGRK